MKDSITIYSSPTCPKCRALKMQLDKANIEYNEEQSNYAPIQERGMHNLPVLQVGDQFFNMSEALNWLHSR